MKPNQFDLLTKFSAGEFLRSSDLPLHPAQKIYAAGH
jgi:hypothetical protein